MYTGIEKSASLSLSLSPSLAVAVVVVGGMGLRAGARDEEEEGVVGTEVLRRLFGGELREVGGFGIEVAQGSFRGMFTFLRCERRVLCWKALECSSSLKSRFRDGWRVLPRD
jgi:hypothetical protein